MVYKRKNSWGYTAAKWGNRAVGAVRTANRIQKGYKRARIAGGSSARHAPGPITGESDYRGVYRRKPMPRRRKRSWVKFSRKVKAVAEKQVASQFQVIRRFERVQQTLSNLQAFTSVFTILGSNGGVPETDDIGDMVSSAFAMAGSTGMTGVVRESIRVHISGWMAECMINNNGTTTAYIDCYYWRAKKDVGRRSTDGTAGFNQMSEIFTSGFNQLAVPTAGPSTALPLSLTQYGVTPFQCPLFSQAFQVYKKTRVKVAAGGTCQLELRSGKNYYRKFSYDSNYTYLRGVSEGCLFVQYGTPNVASPTSSPTDISYSVNVNYTWRRMSDDRMGGVLGQD